MAKKAAAKKKAAKKKNGTAKVRYGADMKVTSVGENPRREGTEGHKKYAEMAKYVKAHPSATVAEVISKTSYKRKDLNWDVERESVKVK